MPFFQGKIECLCIYIIIFKVGSRITSTPKTLEQGIHGYFPAHNKHAIYYNFVFIERHAIDNFWWADIPFYPLFVCFLIMAKHDDEKLKKIKSRMFIVQFRNKFQEMKTRVGKNNDGQNSWAISHKKTFSLLMPNFRYTYLLHSGLYSSLKHLSLCFKSSLSDELKFFFGGRGTEGTRSHAIILTGWLEWSSAFVVIACIK